MKKNWILPTPIPLEQVKEIATKLNISEITSEILIRRGCTTPEKAKNFLNPEISNMHDPFLMPDMKKATDRIIKAIETNEKILIYGDYDVDGTTAAVLLYHVLKKLNGTTPVIYIPNRLKDGYGLTLEGISNCLRDYVNLIITVDCGVTNVAEACFLREKGVDIIITDHHRPDKEIPPAVAVLNPRLQGYPFAELSGCGVAFKLMQAVHRKLGLEERKLLEYLDLVALATVCDVTPLVEENRILTKYGMKLLESTQNIGLQTLIEASGLKNKSLDTYHLSFILGPKINAQGRLSDMRDVITLLTTEDREEALAITCNLIEQNKQRQQIQKDIVNEVVSELKNIDLDEKRGLVFTKEGWHQGVIGIAASKIVEKVYRPTIFITIDGDTGKGSARSIPEFHLYDALYECKDLLTSMGGHKLAAGFIIETQNIPPFKKKFETMAFDKLKSEELVPKLLIEKDISLNKLVGVRLVEELERFIPFGLGNPKPLFLSSDVQIVGYPKALSNKHLKFKVRDNANTVVEAIGFNMGDTSLEMGERINVIYTLDKDNWSGESKLIMKVKDIEKC